MTYTGVELFMENLNMVINRYDYPVINSNPSFLSQLCKIKSFYEELSSMFQTLFVENEHDLHELKEVKNLKSRFTNLVEEAHIIFGLFVYAVNRKSKNHPGKNNFTENVPSIKSPTSSFMFNSSPNIVMRSHESNKKPTSSSTFKSFQNLAMRSQESIKKDFHKLFDNLKMDSPPSINHVKTQPVSAADKSTTKNPDGGLIKEKLVEDQRLPSRSDDCECTLNLEDIMRSLVSIKNEFKSILANMKMDSSPKHSLLKTQSHATSGTSHTRSKTVGNDIIVGLVHDVEVINEKLMGNQKQLDVVSIVGMGGIGKTTLAAKVFNDPFVVYHFHVRAWATVSQTYEKRDVLSQILESIGVEIEPDQRDSYSELRGKLHKRLIDKRYLIVIDDIWSNEAWDDLKPYFPNGYTGSRILLTSRLKEVASHGFLHRLECLTNEESWELICKKVFQGSNCPEWSIESGMLIAKNCRGLPLALVVISGVLAKELTKDSWENVASSVSSHIVGDRDGFVDMLALSYNHLPCHLKDCFLYLGAFPEDHKFLVRTLIWLWMAEGFIQEVESRSLEETATGYLQELVDRNLVNVSDNKLNGAIKAFSVHDLLRELCLEKATQEEFCMKITTRIESLASIKPRRIFTNADFFANKYFVRPSPRVRTLLCLHHGGSMINIPNKYFSSYPLLMVLDIQKCKLYDFPNAIELLVHLRYLAYWYTKGFPSSLCNLRSLQTIIIKSVTAIWLPNTFSKLVNLRHMKSDKDINLNCIEKPMNLQTISSVVLGTGAGSWVENFPAIKKLKAKIIPFVDDHDFKSLTSLVTLGLKGKLYYAVRLPASLRKLSLTGCNLPWSDMSILQSLPNLEVLKILDRAFLGPIWETGEHVFQQLIYLKLQGLDIQHWEASSFNFPCLKRLVLNRCIRLKDIAIELADIPTLELIHVDDCNYSLNESVDQILEEQQNNGNYDLKIRKGTPSFHSWKSQWASTTWN